MKFRLRVVWTVADVCAVPFNLTADVQSEYLGIAKTGPYKVCTRARRVQACPLASSELIRERVLDPP